MFSLLFSKNQTKPTPRAATIFRSAGRDLRNKRSPQPAERSACRAITRGSGGEQSTDIYSIPTSAMRVKTPSAGICTFSALLESECSLFSSPKPTQTDPSSRHHFPISRPRHSGDSFPCSPTARSACRAITRGSGGEQPTDIYSIPTSAMRVKAPSAGICTFSALLESECSLFSSPKPTQTDASSRHHFPICRPRPAQQTQSPTR
jgi:hypothetical protein